MLYGFGSLRWLQAGYSEDAIGVLWAIGVVAEVILFAFGGVLVQRLGPVGLLRSAAAPACCAGCCSRSSPACPCWC